MKVNIDLSKTTYKDKYALYRKEILELKRKYAHSTVLVVILTINVLVFSGYMLFITKDESLSWLLVLCLLNLTYTAWTAQNVLEVISKEIKSKQKRFEIDIKEPIEEVVKKSVEVEN